METDVGSSGAPVCVITEKNEFEYLDIQHKSMINNTRREIIIRKLI